MNDVINVKVFNEDNFSVKREQIKCILLAL